MLHWLVLVLAIWIAFATIVTIPIAPITIVRLINVVVLEGSLVATLILLRIGQFRKASLMHLAGTWLWATFLITFNAGIRSSGFVLYVTLPISAAWLLGYGAALRTAGICLSIALVFAFLEMSRVSLPLYIPATPLGIWAVLVQATLMGAVPVAHVLNTLRDALAQSRRAEEELNAYKDHLQLVVEYRTAELVQARDEALAANKAKNVFLANMSHELRTPLNAILGFSNLMRQHGPSTEQRKDLDIINHSGEQLLSLINDVLDLAKIESGRKDLEAAPCDLRALLQEVIDMIRPRAEEKLLELRLVETPDSPRYIRADAAKLRQMLLNLLGNAVKYTDRGYVELRVASRRTEDRKPRLIFEVEDSGIGIAAGDHTRVFDAFVQVAAARKQKGTGLGLAITPQFADLMGGTIQVESTPGKGSCFRLEIPVDRARESEVNGSRTEPEQVIGLEAGQPEYRVLIVEDEQENRTVLKRLLERAGFPVRIAQDGAEGVESFREWRPHFIWMDVRMPVMNGFDATRRIRALEGGQEVKIAAVTASGFADQRNEALAAGMDDYVRKPFRPNEIFDCMARHLGIRYRHKAVETSGEPAEELRPQDLAGLPHELRAELRDALLALDVARISAAIGRVSQENASLGATFSRCASRYAYTAMLSAIEAGSVQSAGGRG